MSFKRNSVFVAFVMFCSIALGSVLGCERCDPIRGTRETKDKVYQGNAGAVAPHHTFGQGDFSVAGMGCTGATCTYTMLCRVGLHNPTSQPRTANVICDFYIGDWSAGKNGRYNVTVAPKNDVKKTGSVFVEIQQMAVVEPGLREALGATCEVEWK